MLQDARQALRSMKKSPVLTLVILLTLGLGIGVNVAVFTAIDAVLLKPLPVNDPERLVLLWEALPKLAQERLPVTAAEYVNYSQVVKSFAGVAGFRSATVTLTGYRDAERVIGARVSTSVFPLLGVSPAIGRTISVEEDQLHAARVVVLSDALWRRKYGADPRIVGRTIEIERQPHVVVGIMPASFTFPFRGTPFANPAELWVPLALTHDELRSTAANFSINVIARLADGISVSQATSEVNATAATFRKQHPELYPANMEITASVESLEAVLAGPVRPLLLLMQGAAAAVLLIACANIANVLLARSLGRSQELAIRVALGAERTRLIRQLLTESLLLALIGGMVGLATAFGVISVIRAFEPPQLGWLSQLEPDLRVLLFAVLLAVLTGIGSGLVPALRMSHVHIRSSLHGGSTSTAAGGGPDRHVLQGLLTIIQIASSVILLIGAGLLINSFLLVLRVPPGFDADGVLVAHTVFEQPAYPSAAARRAAESRILERLAAIPGVKASAAASVLPFSPETRIGVRLDTEGFEQVHIVNHSLITPDYFKVMGIPLLAGRAPGEHDTATSPLVVVVSRAFAQRHWPGQEPIGKRLQWGRGRPPFTVIGVAPDVKVSGLDSEPLPMVYMSMLQVDSISPEVAFAVSTAGAPQSVASALRTEVLSVDKDLPLFRVGAMSDLISESLAQRRFSMLLLTVFSFVSLLLAASGLYAVVSFFTTERTQEFGVRMALGAQRRDVLWPVLRQAGSLVAIGLVIGLAVASGLSGFMRGMVYGINVLDPMTFVGVSLVFAIVALLASSIPALRAANTDPLLALRAE